MRAMQLLLSWMLVGLAATSCASTSTAPDRTTGSSDLPRAGATKRITAAVPADLPAVPSVLNAGAGGQGRAIQELALAGLTIYDPVGRLHPQLAEAVPPPD